MEELFASSKPGVFIEAGAHDGWTGSNTYWLEASMGWRGILVEPVPGLYEACKKERPQAKVFHGALVAKDYGKTTIEIECSGLVSSVKESPLLDESREIARKYYGAETRPTIFVPALTLETCIDLCGFTRIDFLSLDVEGFEAQALQGLDLNQWRIPYLLIECNDEDAVRTVLGERYVLERRIAPRDILFRRVEP
jgi:FkbM family methyltransferase